MIASVDMLNNHRKRQEEYAAHFLRRTGDSAKLQSMRASRLSGGEVLRLAMYERELRVREQGSPRPPEGSCLVG